MMNKKINSNKALTNFWSSILMKTRTNGHCTFMLLSCNKCYLQNTSQLSNYNTLRYVMVLWFLLLKVIMTFWSLGFMKYFHRNVLSFSYLINWSIEALEIVLLFLLLIHWFWTKDQPLLLSKVNIIMFLEVILPRLGLWVQTTRMTRLLYFLWHIRLRIKLNFIL